MDNFSAALLINEAIQRRLEIQILQSTQDTQHETSHNNRREHRRKRMFTHYRSKCGYEQSLKGYFRNKTHRKLMQAVNLNDVDRVVSILKSEKGDGVNRKDDFGRSALHVASSRGYYDVVVALIQAGADPNIEDNLGNTPLHLAVNTGSVATVRTLITSGCRVRRTAKLSLTPLELAQTKLALLHKSNSFNNLLNHQEIISLLIEAIESDVKTKREISSILNSVADLQLDDRQSPRH